MTNGKTITAKMLFSSKYLRKSQTAIRHRKQNSKMTITHEYKIS